MDLELRRSTVNRLELELVPIADLIEEVMSRTESCVICWEQFKPDRDGCNVKGVWKASKTTTALGMCEMTKRYIMDDITWFSEEDFGDD